MAGDVCKKFKNSGKIVSHLVRKIKLFFFLIILTRIKLHTIFYAYASLLDKYCKQDMCDYTECPMR